MNLLYDTSCSVYGVEFNVIKNFKREAPQNLAIAMLIKRLHITLYIFGFILMTALVTQYTTVQA